MNHTENRVKRRECLSEKKGEDVNGRQDGWGLDGNEGSIRKKGLLSFAIIINDNILE
jgi:hypothetical protein